MRVGQSGTAIEPSTKLSIMSVMKRATISGSVKIPITLRFNRTAVVRLGQGFTDIYLPNVKGRCEGTFHAIVAPKTGRLRVVNFFRDESDTPIDSIDIHRIGNDWYYVNYRTNSVRSMTNSTGSTELAERDLVFYDSHRKYLLDETKPLLQRVKEFIYASDKRSLSLVSSTNDSGELTILKQQIKVFSKDPKNSEVTIKLSKTKEALSVQIYHQGDLIKEKDFPL